MNTRIEKAEYGFDLIKKYTDEGVVNITGLELCHHDDIGFNLCLIIEDEREYDSREKESVVYDHYQTSVYAEGSYYEALAVANEISWTYGFELYFMDELFDYNKHLETLIDFCNEIYTDCDGYKSLTQYVDHCGYSVLCVKRCDEDGGDVILNKDPGSLRINELNKKLREIIPSSVDDNKPLENNGDILDFLSAIQRAIASYKYLIEKGVPDIKLLASFDEYSDEYSNCSLQFTFDFGYIEGYSNKIVIIEKALDNIGVVSRVGETLSSILNLKMSWA